MSRIVYGSSKTYTHNIGLSCCFRQHRATSHCRFFHGYALQVELEFTTERLDQNNWVVDFGGLKEIKAWLEKQFDHKMLVARDDPQESFIRELEIRGLAEITWVDKVGCEAFSQMIWTRVSTWMITQDYYPRVHLKEVRVREHAGNSAFVREES